MQHAPLVLPYQHPLIIRYADPARIRVLYEVQIDAAEFVRVIGDPENGAYEWLIQTADYIKHSDAGYGQSAIALRDGLFVYFEDATLSLEKICSEGCVRKIERVIPFDGAPSRWRYVR